MMEEQNDFLKRGINLPIKRYQFAIKCLGYGYKFVTDAGCGMGCGSFMLRNAGYEVIGIDKSEKAIAYAREHYPGDYKVADLEEMEFIADDAVVCLETLCHLKNPQNFIDKIKAKELVISVPINPNPDDGYKYRLWNLSEEDFREMLKGWEIKDELRQKGYLVLYCKKI